MLAHQNVCNICDSMTMRILNGARKCFLVGSVLVGITAAAQGSAAQSVEMAELSARPALVEPSHTSVTGEQILADLVKHNELRNAELQRYSAIRTYSVTDLNGKVHAKEIVRMEYIAPDKKTFETVTGEGSDLIRHLVLNRLMESEASAAEGKERRDSSITAENYTFHVLGEEDLGMHHCFVVEALPKRPDKFLFEGKVWIDSTEFAIVKISGHPAKKLSFWVTRADFVRQYEKTGGFWLPARDETLVDVRLYGKKILNIEHYINSVNGLASLMEPAPIVSSR